MEQTVTLSSELWTRLTTYLLMTTSHREGERKAWEELAEEKTEAGEPKYPHARSNAQFWAETETMLEEIRTAIDEARPVEPSEVLEATRRECSRMVKEASGYEGKLAWYYTHVGELDMAAALGYLTEEEHHRLAEEWKKEKPTPPKRRQARTEGAR